jgi:uncharacterized protein (DUF1499 family)
MSILKWVVVVVLLLVVLLVLAGQLGFLRGKPPSGLGVHEGRLKRPSATPNSAHSQAERWPGDAQQAYAQVAPLALKGDGAATIARLKALLEATPGVTIVQDRPDYLYATCQTRLLKFVDDFEAWFDPAAGVVQVRSASRLGRKDFGVNRARVEALRTALAAS